MDSEMASQEASNPPELFERWIWKQFQGHPTTNQREGKSDRMVQAVREDDLTR